MKNWGVLAIFMTMASPALSADDISYEQYAAQQNSYEAGQTSEDCDQLRVTYRTPYEPHSEVVTVCTPPFEWK